GHDPQADKAAPVLTEEVRVLEVEVIDQQAADPLDVTRIGVLVALGWLVGATEADQVGGNAAEPARDEHRDHRAVEEAPRRLAVHEYDDLAVSWALVEVMHPQRAAVRVRDLGVVRREREVGQTLKALIGCAQNLHYSVPFRQQTIKRRTDHIDG